MSGSLIGNYGINLDATLGGEINFNGNTSQGELNSSNNDTSINYVGGTVNYG